ncbi:hypothetical protein, partial [Butyrivibrio proteoclasticus]|uniref:hypothetical protein n=1 Tax=Butyrivibrio proteoclasticus TaxID=43305 RepID=UPI000553C844
YLWQLCCHRNKKRYRGKNMTNEELEARRAAIQAEISKYQGILDQLEADRNGISETINTIKESVEDPIVAPYDLAEGDKWRGLNYNEAETKVSDIGSSLSSYRGETLSLLGQIDKAIGEVQEKIEELYQELASLG